MKRWHQDSPDCETCVGQLYDANKNAHQVYNAIQGQVIISSMGEVITINQLAIWAYIDHYKMPNQTRIFEQVCKLAQEIINDERVDSGN